MSITVNTNMQALRIQQNLTNATDKMNTAMERMSSGSKINSAKDDAAGLAVSTKLEKTISSSKVASDNVTIAANLLDTSEGNLDTIEANLSRIRDLSEQAATGTYSADDVAAIVSEIVQRVQEIDRSAGAATFNDVALFDSSSDAGTSGLKLQIGTESTDTLTLASSLFGDATASSLGLFSVDGSGNLSLMNSAGTSVAVYSNAGATTAVNVFTSNALDYTKLSTALTNVFTGDTYTAANTVYSASNFLNNVDAAITEVTDKLTDIGAYQNRLESISASLEVQQTNLLAANSTIKDADVAQESASYVQAQILQSASATLLVQANSAPQIALTLIQG